MFPTKRKMAAFSRHFGRTFAPAENQRFSPGDPGIPRAPHASVLTALRHKCRAFTVHAAESAGIAMGLRPIPLARVLHPRAPTLLRDANKTLLRGKRNLRASVPEHNAHLFGVYLSTMCQFSETELRAAQPYLHRGRIFAHACKSRRAK